MNVTKMSSESSNLSQDSMFSHDFSCYNLFRKQTTWNLIYQIMTVLQNVSPYPKSVHAVDLFFIQAIYCLSDSYEEQIALSEFAFIGRA